MQNNCIFMLYFKRKISISASPEESMCKQKHANANILLGNAPEIQKNSFYIITTPITAGNGAWQQAQNLSRHPPELEKSMYIF